MKKFMEKIADFFKSNMRIAILILFILELFINIWITPDRYDSAFFIQKMQEMSLMDFISMRYQTWTSRVFIEIIVCSVLTHNKIIWIILNTLMTTLIGYCIIKLFVKNDDKSMIWTAICMFLLYPLNKIATCDWGAGSINYTWPLAMLLFSCLSIKKIFSGEKIPKYMYILYLIALIFACNQEQTCAVAFVIYVIFTVFAIIKDKKKVHPFMIIQLLIVIASLVFIMTCPGNYARKTDEISTYYPDYQTLNIFDKISLGLTSTVNSMLIGNNIVFLVFSLICAVYIFKMYKENLYRAIALIPLVASLAFGIFKDFLCSLYPYFGMFCEMLQIEDIMINATNYSNFLNFLPLILACVVLGSIALNILLIFRNLKDNIAILVYLVGVMTRVAMGFSPTIFASTDRTFLFFDIALIIIGILVLQEFMKQTDKAQIKSRTRLETFIAVLAVLQYSHTLIYALISQI